MFGKDYQSFRRHASELKQGKYPSMTSIPESVQNEVKMMLIATPELRINLHEFTKVSCATEFCSSRSPFLILDSVLRRHRRQDVALSRPTFPVGQSTEVKVLQRIAASHQQASASHQRLQNHAVLGEGVRQSTDDSFRSPQRSANR
jgi:hypothetical protein